MTPHVVWDGRRLVVVDPTGATARLRPGAGAWEHIGSLPLQPSRGGVDVAPFGDGRIVVRRARGFGVLSTAGTWSIGRATPQFVEAMVGAGDRVLAWSASAADGHLPPTLQALTGRPAGGGRSFGRTVPVGTVLFDIPAAARIGEATTLDPLSPDGPPIQLRVDGLDAGSCTLTSQPGTSLGYRDDRPEHEEHRALTGPDGETYEGLVFRLAPGEGADDLAHFLLAETDDDVLDIACADFETADDLLGRIHR